MRWRVLTRHPFEAATEAVPDPQRSRRQAIHRVSERGARESRAAFTPQRRLSLHRDRTNWIKTPFPEKYSRLSPTRVNKPQAKKTLSASIRRKPPPGENRSASFNAGAVGRGGKSRQPERRAARQWIARGRRGHETGLRPTKNARRRKSPIATKARRSLPAFIPPRTACRDPLPTWPASARRRDRTGFRRGRASFPSAPPFFPRSCRT